MSAKKSNKQHILDNPEKYAIRQQIHNLEASLTAEQYKSPSMKIYDPNLIKTDIEALQARLNLSALGEKELKADQAKELAASAKILDDLLATFKQMAKDLKPKIGKLKAQHKGRVLEISRELDRLAAR